MIKKILELFGKAAPGKEQSQREALLDLLVLAMFSDHHVANAEGVHIRELAAALAWEGDRGVEQFIDAATRRARDVLGSERAQGAYLEDISIRLASQEQRAEAYAACQELIAVDGERAEAELSLLEEVKRAFSL